VTGVVLGKLIRFLGVRRAGRLLPADERLYSPHSPGSEICVLGEGILGKIRKSLGPLLS